LNRHPFDPFSFVFGFAFAALGVVLLDTRVDIADLSGRWLLPLPIMFFGLLIGALALNRVRANTEARRTDPWGSEAEDLTREDTLEG
jgi:hypothetical protein